MTRYIFPYGIRFRADRHIELFPAAELLIQGRKQQGIRAVFHIDSGATVSVLPAGDAQVLGISLTAGKKTAVHGIGGEPLTGYEHTIAVHLNGTKIKIPVVFVEQEHVPRILGRDGVFSRFVIVFDETHRRVAFLDAAAHRTAVDQFFSGRGHD